jgi:Zn finger protein HypA/HybF involved in hydrogenase expression
MHEMSMAMEIARVAEERLGTAAWQLVAVGVRVGDRAGVEPANLSFCLDAVFATPPFRGARCDLVPAAGDVLQIDYFEIDDGNPDD